MAEEYAVRVQNISKVYKLYKSNKDRLVEALGLTRKKRYQEHYALNDVSFDIRKGETVGIIGTNGAGKSTILKIITGVLNPSGGKLEINGRISALLELGAGFNGEYSGIENIYLNGTMMGYTREEVDAKMDQILEFADIGEFVHQPVKTYSSGMFVRLAFAVAINIDPEILVVDEALSVGDVFFQAKCYKKFEEFKKEGKTILLVSHDLGAIAKYCDRVILLNHGKKLCEGEPKGVIDTYKKILTGSADDQKKILEENGQFDEAGLIGEENARIAGGSVADVTGDGEELWKTHFEINPNLNEYGNRRAEIIDFAIVDDQGTLTSTIIKGSRFTIKSKVRFNDDVKEPIFTFTFKTVRGQDVTGTNTMYEDKMIPLAKKGDIYVASFTQNMDLQGGEYLLSMSCTGFEKGDLTAFHRCYDLISVNVVSQKNTVGFYDMNSETTVEKIN
jgi:teichoic acid transport system ATP-binding protein